ncbi:MAG: GspH/FimT family pseudopilin [Candidatus Acidiferrales bacterium]
MTRLGNRANRTCTSGFSTVELVIAVAVILIISGVALPSFLRSYRTYQLTDASTKIANLLKLTRFEAIRRNTPVNFRLQAVANGTNLWADSLPPINNGVMDRGEPQVVFTGTVVPIASGAAPGAGALAAAVNVPAIAYLSPAAATVTFDQRGATNPPAVSALFVGNTAVPGLGSRAVVLLPSGSVQVWSADTTGTWHLLN